MKNNSVTMMKMNVLSESQDKILDEVVLPKMGEIFDESDEKFIAVEEIDGVDVMFFFVEQHKVDTLEELMNEHGLIEFSKEVSEEVLLTDFDSDMLKMMQSEEFKSIFDSFIVKNLKSDMVLDKILLKGVESLSDIDKDVLENAE